MVNTSPPESLFHFITFSKNRFVALLVKNSSHKLSFICNSCVYVKILTKIRALFQYIKLRRCSLNLEFSTCSFLLNSNNTQNLSTAQANYDQPWNQESELSYQRFVNFAAYPHCSILCYLDTDVPKTSSKKVFGRCLLFTDLQQPTFIRNISMLPSLLSSSHFFENLANTVVKCCLCTFCLPQKSPIFPDNKDWAQGSTIVVS